MPKEAIRFLDSLFGPSTSEGFYEADIFTIATELAAIAELERHDTSVVLQCVLHGLPRDMIATQLGIGPKEVSAVISGVRRSFRSIDEPTQALVIESLRAEAAASRQPSRRGEMIEIPVQEPLEVLLPETVLEAAVSETGASERGEEAHVALESKAVQPALPNAKPIDERFLNSAEADRRLRQQLKETPAMTTSAYDESDPLAWQQDGLCGQTDPEAFYPEKGGSTRDAKRVCGRCAVRAACLEYALDNDERFGIWGGLSERERRRLKRSANNLSSAAS